MRTNDSQIGFIRRSVLKFLTKCQEISLKSDNGLYDFFTNLHFRVYSGSSLAKCANAEDISQVDMYAKAAHRHGSMVVSLLYKDSKDKKKRHSQAVSAFIKNHLLEQKL